MPVIVTSAGPSRWRAVPAALFAAVAVWLSSGAIAFRNPSGARVGVLPIAALPFAAAALVAVLVLAVGVRNPRGAAVGVSPLALLVIPWLPVPLPPAFLIWTGALTMPIWIGTALALVSCAWSEHPIFDVDRAHVVRPVRPAGKRDVLLAFAAGCIVFGAAAWCASAAIPGGDEPHYLVITQSLLHDHDLDVENNYANGDYREYYGGPLSPDFRVRGRHGELYSIHAPGVPALVLPAFALGGYRAVVVFLVAVSAAACALAWWIAWRATGSLVAAWFGWAVVVFAAPFLLESFTVYPDGPGAAIVLTGFWALWRNDAGETPSSKAWLLHGAALAALPWLHTRFTLLAILLGLSIVVRLLRTRNSRHVPVFLVIPVLSAAGWIGAAFRMYGTFNPAAAYGGQSDTALTFLPDGLGGLLFDQGFGIVATAPALVVAFLGLRRTRRLAIEWGVIASAYAVAVGSYAMWWAGTSGPARLLVPLLLPLAVPAAAAWHGAASRGVRVSMTLALVLSVWISAVMAAGGDGFLAYHSRNVYGATPAPWLGWANTLVDLSRALPAFVPLPRGTPVAARMAAARDGFAALVPWTICFAAALAFVLALGRDRRARLHEVVAASVGVFAAATMIAASVVWWMHGGDRVNPLNAQLDVVRRLSSGRALALDLQNARRVAGIEALKMRLDVPVDSVSGTPAAVAEIPLLPAGSYLVSTRGTLAADASVFAGADDERFPLMRATPAEFARGITIDLPIAVRALSIRAASPAGVSGVEVRPIGAARFRDRAAADRVARHSARYGDVPVFFVDDRTAPEEDGFWIWGAREGAIVSTARDVVLRNGAAQNDVTVRTGDAVQHLTLGPGEERPLSIPPADVPRAQLTRIRTSAGFRPADVDPRSHDRRFLGVYVVMPDHAVR